MLRLQAHACQGCKHVHTWNSKSQQTLSDFSETAGSKLSRMGMNTPEGRRGSRAWQKCEQRLAGQSRQRALRSYP